MKVGIDGVLLGAWTKVRQAKLVLDVGTGTGLLALMLAQKKPDLHIDALEIDEIACQVAESNITASPFNARISVVNESMQEYASQTTNKYDLIVSNPPFYDEDIKPQNTQRKVARHSDSLPFKELMLSAQKMLNESGEISFIYPYKKHILLDEIIVGTGFYIKEKVFVKPDDLKQPNRVLYRIGQTLCQKEESTICLRENGEYAQIFRELTNDYYTSLK